MTPHGSHRGNSIAHKHSQLFLGYETALLFWRAVHEGRLPYPEPLDIRAVSTNSITGLRELLRTDLSPLGIAMTASGAVALYEERLVDWGSRQEEHMRRGLVPTGLALPPGSPVPLHVLTADARRRRSHGQGIKVHLTEGTLPKGSFCQVADHLVVASPELTLLQVCSASRDLPNIELALELCGTYALHPSVLPCKFKVSPVLAHRGIVRFAEESARRWGVRALREVLTWACDGLASPREAELYLLLVLPPEAGGYGLPLPTVNGAAGGKRLSPAADESMSDAQAALAEAIERLEPYIPDFLWVRDNRIVVLEYDGFEEHEVDAAKVTRDKERRSEFAARGCTVIVVSKRDMASLVVFETKVAQLMRALGLAVGVEEEGTSARRALFRWLANPQHDHLPFGFGYH